MWFRGLKVASPRTAPRQSDAVEVLGPRQRVYLHDVSRWLSVVGRLAGMRVEIFGSLEVAAAAESHPLLHLSAATAGMHDSECITSVHDERALLGAWLCLGLVPVLLTLA